MRLAGRVCCTEKLHAEILYGPLHEGENLEDLKLMA